MARTKIALLNHSFSAISHVICTQS